MNYRLGQAPANEPANLLHFRADDRYRSAASIQTRRGASAIVDLREALACKTERALTRPALVRAQTELENALAKDDDEIDAAKRDEEAKVTIDNRAVDDPPLKLEWDHTERSDQDRNHAKPD